MLRRARSVATAGPKPAKRGGSGSGSGRSQGRRGSITAPMVAAAAYRRMTPPLPAGQRLSGRTVRPVAPARRFASHSCQATRIWLALKIDE